jgi:hypothetical protein
MALIQNFSITAGDSADLNFTLLPDVNVSLVGAQISWKVYDSEFAVPVGDPILEKTVGSGIVVTNPGLLEFTVSIDPLDTSGLQVGNYYYQVVVIDTQGNVTTPTQGIMTITLRR